MILVVSTAADPTARGVLAELAARGCEARLVEFGRFLQADRLAIRFDADGRRDATYTQGEHPIALDRVRAVFWRRPADPEADAAIASPEVRAYVEQTTLEVLNSAFDDLDCLHVPARRAHLRRAQWKLPQLALAGRLGFRLPETLVGNDPDALLAFVNAAPGDVVVKSANTTQKAVIGRAATGYANRINRSDLKFLDDARLCPFIAQHYVPKRLEVRVTVVGDTVFAAEIHSQASARTADDWRRYNDGGTPYRVHELPAVTAGRCVALLRALGLCYAAIDLILTPDGEYVFLEANPGGQYGWIEERTGLPITHCLATLLAAGR